MPLRRPDIRTHHLQFSENHHRCNGYVDNSLPRVPAHPHCTTTTALSSQNPMGDPSRTSLMSRKGTWGIPICWRNAQISNRVKSSAYGVEDAIYHHSVTAYCRAVEGGRWPKAVGQILSTWPRSDAGASRACEAQPRFGADGSQIRRSGRGLHRHEIG